jgi:DNA repair photolyase
LNKTKRRDPWFLDDYTVNPFSGCSFNCLFCYIRGSKYGEHMDDAMQVKSNAAALLEKQLLLRAKKGEYGIIVLSSATDPYLKIEKEIGLTRQMLEIILKYRFPVHIITRSNLVTRDLDLLQKINEAAILPKEFEGKLKGGVMVTFSFSTLDDKVAKIFEPGATPPSLRLKAMAGVKKSGLTCGASLMPLLPWISDTTEELTGFFETFKALGADYVMPATLTLYGTGKADSKTLLLNAVIKHYPHLAAKYKKYFAHADGMPSFYRNAFGKKMKELGEKYNLPAFITSPDGSSKAT